MRASSAGPDRPRRSARPADAPRRFRTAAGSPTCRRAARRRARPACRRGRRAGPCRAAWRWRLRIACDRSACGCQASTLMAAGSSTANSDPPTHARQASIRRRGLHRDERPLGREHHAEDQQHQRAADVDHQSASRRRNRPRPERTGPRWPPATAPDRTPSARCCWSSTTATAKPHATQREQQEEDGMPVNRFHGHSPAGSAWLDARATVGAVASGSVTAAACVAGVAACVRGRDAFAYALRARRP